jgi:hypothetical protein
MELGIIAVGILTAWGIVATVRSLVTDGYRPVPFDRTRR